MQKEKLQLPEVTLVAMTSVKIQETIQAMLYSMREIEYGDVVLITHEKPAGLPDCIRYAYIEQLKCIDDFNYDILYRLHRYIQTKFCLLVHYDGYVVNPKSWKKEFLDYDYIGSPWEKREELKNDRGEYYRVGNSVSIRSKRLLEFPEKYGISWEDWKGSRNEDTFLCVYFRKMLEEQGMRIAPFELALYFGRETTLPENKAIDPFIFHKGGYLNHIYPNFEAKGSGRIPDFLRKLKWNIIRMWWKITC